MLALSAKRREMGESEKRVSCILLRAALKADFSCIRMTAFIEIDFAFWCGHFQRQQWAYYGM